jgi:hypothetical protein
MCYTVDMKRLNIKQKAKYGRLEILKELATVNGKRVFLTKCRCGSLKEVRLNDLLMSNTLSCGCLRKEKIRALPKAVKHGMSGKQFYNVYRGMIGRCNKPYTNSYAMYGGRGIKCLWNSFEEFKADMHKAYLKHVERFGEEQTTLDRKNGNGNYLKENCRWVTWKTQRKNRLLANKY